MSGEGTGAKAEHVLELAPPPPRDWQGGCLSPTRLPPFRVVAGGLTGVPETQPARGARGAGGARGGSWGSRGWRGSWGCWGLVGLAGFVGLGAGAARQRMERRCRARRAASEATRKVPSELAVWGEMT